MAIRFITCRNTKTGAIADLPETALPHFTDYEPITAEPETPAPTPAAPAPQPEPEAAPKRARKTPAAGAATTEKE